MLRELNVKRKVLANDIIKGAPTPPSRDYEIQNRLNRLKERQEPKNNNNNTLSPPPSPLPPSPSAPFIPPPPALFQPAPSVFDSFQPQAPRTDSNFQPPPSIFNSFQQPAPRTDKNFGNFHVPAQLSSFNRPSAKGPSNNLFGSQTAVLNREKEQENVVQESVQKELDDTLYKLPDMSILELGDGLLNALRVEANDVLDSQLLKKKRKR